MCKGHVPFECQIDQMVGWTRRTAQAGLAAGNGLPEILGTRETKPGGCKE